MKKASKILLAGLIFGAMSAGRSWGQLDTGDSDRESSQPTQASKVKEELDPVGQMHIPIGLPNTLDSLKTFVESEGGFSPGTGSFGVSFWVFDPSSNKLSSPTMSDVLHERGLSDGRALIPFSRWSAGTVSVCTEVCQVRRQAARQKFHLVGARASLANPTERTQRVLLYVALRPMGPAGYAVTGLDVDEAGDALLVEGHPAIVANSSPSAAGVSQHDSIGRFAAVGSMPVQKHARSAKGNCSGALRFDLSIPAGATKTIGVVCPVHAGRRAVRHNWVPRANNFVDDAVPKSKTKGIDQPDLGVEYYRTIRSDELFAEAQSYWDEFYSASSIRLPDPRWSKGFDVMLAHAGLCMNESAADVAVTNYTVFNRDGMYIANMMQKAGRPGLSEDVIDYFLRSPFNGRPYPEADNPGQVLWSLGQHWQLTQDETWLHHVYPAAEKLARMIQYYRTHEEPHWVSLTSLDFGEALPESQRLQLKPGSCDGFHPEYTEAFDIAGLRVMADLATAFGDASAAAGWRELADRMFAEYDAHFGKQLGKGYGSYCVLWPCQLYPTDRGPAHEQFRHLGKTGLSKWRYFAPATAHQGLLAGNRQAGYATVNLHLDHPQMQGWFAFDEGGRSGSGGWQHLRTTWTHSKEEPDKNHAVAMPHGWAIAEVWLLMRDSLLVEDAGRLRLLSGVPEDWFTDEAGMQVENLATVFGCCSLRYTYGKDQAVVELTGDAAPPRGFVVCLPPQLNARARCDGNVLSVAEDGRCSIPATARRVDLTFSTAR